MKKYLLIPSLTLALGFFTACSSDDVTPIEVSNLPQVIFPDDEGDGNIEDDDNMSVKLTLLDKFDASGEELTGSIVPLSQDATVSFIIQDLEGFDAISDYILDWVAFYEIDDCTTSQDNDEDLDLTFDPSTGEGTVTFPAGVEEIEIEFELNPDLFDDDALNAEDRGFIFQLTGVNSDTDVKVNDQLEFEYDVLDNEAIYGDWELDPSSEEDFNNFVSLYSIISEDVADLSREEVDKIEFSFGYDKLEIKIELVEEELIEECGESELAAKEIELEMEYDDLTTDALSGEASFEDKLKFDDGSEPEFTYEEEFSIEEGTLTLTLAGEFEDEEAEEVSLSLTK